MSEFTSKSEKYDFSIVHYMEDWYWKYYDIFALGLNFKLKRGEVNFYCVINMEVQNWCRIQFSAENIFWKKKVESRGPEIKRNELAQNWKYLNNTAG